MTATEFMQEAADSSVSSSTANRADPREIAHGALFARLGRVVLRDRRVQLIMDGGYTWHSWIADHPTGLLNIVEGSYRITRAPSKQTRSPGLVGGSEHPRPRLA